MDNLEETEPVGIESHLDMVTDEDDTETEIEETFQVDASQNPNPFEVDETEENTEVNGTFDQLVGHTFIKPIGKKQLLVVGKEAAELFQQGIELSIEAEKSKKEFKSRVDALDSQLERKYQIFRDGGEELTEECVTKYDRENEDIVYFFEDTEVDRRNMTDAEREQLTFETENEVDTEQTPA